MAHTRQEIDFRPLQLEGQTLKRHRDEVMRITQETGHYAGLKQMELKENEPILYNKMFSRLRAGVSLRVRQPNASPLHPLSNKKASCALRSTVPSETP